MTAPSVSSSSAAPPPRNPVPDATPAAPATERFDQQLQAARQRHGSRNPDSGPLGPNARDLGSNVASLNKATPAGSPGDDKPVVAQATQPPVASPAPPVEVSPVVVPPVAAPAVVPSPVVSPPVAALPAVPEPIVVPSPIVVPPDAALPAVPPPVVVPPVAALPDVPSPVVVPPVASSPVATAGRAATEADESSQTTRVSDETASALAGAMLALMGPAMAGVLSGANSAASSGAAPSGSDGKPAVGGGAVANLLQPGVTVAAAAAANAPDAMTPLSVLRDALAPPGAEVRHVSATDLAPTAGLHAPPATPATTTPLLLQVPSPVGSQAFAQELGQQVAWLGGQSIKQARIQLRPEELGALDVKITVHQGRVDVVFNAQHAGAVAAVQQSLPQLDQMLAQHGLSLGHAEVGQQSRGDGQGHTGDGRATASDESGEIHAIGPALTVRQVGLLDTFA